MGNTKALEVARKWAADTITLKDDGLSVSIAITSVGNVIQTAIDEATADLRAQLAEAQARLLVCQWQPIETAPKDGTRVILASYIKPSKEAAKNEAVAYWDVRDGCHFGSRDSNLWTGILGQPTHWMPLPPPPQANKGDE